MGWRERDAEAVATITACRETLAATGRTVIGEATGKADSDIADWRHYPADEVYDATSHAQYFYHRHPETIPGPEHGHFHLFLRGEGMPLGVAPLVLPEIAVANAPVPRQSEPLKRGSRDEVCHLIAIAIDRQGEPARLFTTNRWVTGETWYRADDVIRMLDHFQVRGEQPSALLNRWLGALVRLFQPEISVLLQQRDRTIAEARWRSRRKDAFENPALEITSQIGIDLDTRLDAVARRAATRNPALRRAALPLRQSDGWGV